jgi:iron complex transport system ATP-binding protein
MLEVKNIGFSVADKWLVKDISYQFHSGKCYMLCGPNGAGKSSLLKLLSLELPPRQGEIFYNAQLVDQRKKKTYAKYRAVLSQQVDISFPLSVEEVMDMLQVAEFRKRNFLTLSGGEKQRVQFARVLSQIWETPEQGCRILLLDEPISSLDLKYQFDFLHHLKNFIDPHTIVIAILHDLNLALNYADEVLLLSKGKLFAQGLPREVLSPKNIEEVFHLQTALHHLQDAGFLWYAKH